MSKSKIIVLILVLVLLLIYSPISKGFNGSSYTTHLSRTSLKSTTTRVSGPAGMKSAEVAGTNAYHVVGNQQSSNSVPSPLQTNISIQNSSLGESAFDTQTNQLLVLDNANNTIARIGDNGTIHYMWSLGKDPSSVLFDPLNNLTYIANSGTNNVAVFSQYGAIASIAVGTRPADMTLDLQNQMVYVSNEGSGNITLISNLSVYSSISVDSIPASVEQNSQYMEATSPTSLTYDSQNGYVYVFDNYRYSVDVISGQKIVDTINTGITDAYAYRHAPASLLFDPYNGYVYLTNPPLGTVDVISTSQIAGTVDVGYLTAYLAFNPRNGQIYAMNRSGAVYELNGFNVTRVIDVGIRPVSGSYDPLNGLFYIISANPGNITVLNATLATFHSITFDESGLPSGTQWIVKLAGLNIQSSSTSVVFNVTNGDYSFNIPLITETNSLGYEAVNLTDVVFVNGSSVILNISFKPVVLSSVMVEATGLPSNYSWWLNTSLGQHFHSGANTTTIYEPNGTLSYLAQTTSRDWFSLKGEANISDTTPALHLNFTLYENKISVYMPGFNLTPSLPANTTFYIVMSNGASFPLEYDSSNLTVYGQFYIPNGTYVFNIVSSNNLARGGIFVAIYENPYRHVGNIDETVDGFQNALVAWAIPGDFIYLDGSVLFLYAFYFFHESGLPANASWNLSLSGVFSGSNITAQLNTSTGLKVALFNGTYSYTAVSSDPQYQRVVGNFSVAGNFSIQNDSYTTPTESFPIYFHLKEFRLIVNVSGLPSRTTIELRLNRENYTINQTSEQLLLPIGNYTYQFQNTSLYYTTNSTGGISLDKNTPLSVNYLPYAHILGILNESGTIVKVNNATVSLLNGYFDEKVPAGHYTIELITTNGSHFENVTLNPGQSFEVTPPAKSVTFHPQQALLAWPFYVLLAVLIVESVVFSSYLIYRGKKR